MLKVPPNRQKMLDIFARPNEPLWGVCDVIGCVRDKIQNGGLEGRRSHEEKKPDFWDVLRCWMTRNGQLQEH